MAQVVHRADDLPVAKRLYQRQLRLDDDARGRPAKPDMGKAENPLTSKIANLAGFDPDVFKLGTLDGSLEHSTRFVLVDRKSQIRGFYLTSEPDAISRLIADARGLLK